MNEVRIEIETDYFYTSFDPAIPPKWFYKIYKAFYKGEGLEKIKYDEMLIEESEESYKSQSCAKKAAYKRADIIEDEIKKVI